MSYKNNLIEPGSKWTSSDYSKFVVISVTEIEGHTWVYYRKLNVPEGECSEYSCYAETFTHRFSRIVNE